MSVKTRIYLIIISFLSLFPLYFFLMTTLGKDNIFLRVARMPMGFLAVLSILALCAFAIAWILDLLVVMKRRIIKPRLGKLLVSEGYITKEELEAALSLQSLKFGEVLINENRITMEQLSEALEVQKKVHMKVGEILKEMGYVTDEDINMALAKMRRRIGRVLLDMGLVSDYDVGRSLLRQRKPIRF